jgi:hypothetical protein
MKRDPRLLLFVLEEDDEMIERKIGLLVAGLLISAFWGALQAGVQKIRSPRCPRKS